MKNRKQNISPKDIIDDQEKFLSKRLSNMDVFDHVLKNAKEVDFLQETGAEEEIKIKRKDKIVIAVDEALKVADELNLGFAVHNTTPFIFNYSFWSKSNPVEMKDFLGAYATKIGIIMLDAKYFRFKEDLYNQFLSVANWQNTQSDTQALTLINLRNGTLEITPTAYKLRNFDKKDFLKYQLDFDYEEDPKRDLFDNYLEKVLPDKKLQDIVAEYLGGIFIPNSVLKLEKILFLYGTGSNGKSVLYDIIEKLFGRDNFSSFSLNKLLTSDNARFQIKDKLVNFSSEVGDMKNYDTFKKLASRESIDAKSLYHDIIEIDNYAKLIFNCNKLPKINEITKGYFRRFLIIPFEVEIKEEEQDKSLATKIIENELPGVLKWVLDGLQRLITNENYSKSDKLDEVLNRFIRESDTVRLFVEDYGIKKSSDEHKLVSLLYDDFKDFCREGGYKYCARRNFCERLENIGFQKTRKSQGYVFMLEIDNN